MTLLEALRYGCGLTGAKPVSIDGSSGASTIWIDGKLAAANIGGSMIDSLNRNASREGE